MVHGVNDDGSSTGVAAESRKQSIGESWNQREEAPSMRNTPSHI
jgi:hypothetical protein